MKAILPKDSLNQLFTKARTHHGWLPEAVSEETLEHLYELLKWGPTCVNGAPARIVFVKTPEAKERLLSCLMEKNVGKTKAASVTAIIAYDLHWYEQLPKLFPQADYRPMYATNAHLNEATAFRNSTLQGAYFMLAARSVGLDVGPMSGFDLGKVDELFFNGSSLRANFLCNLGYGDPVKVYPRGPRLEFAEVCRIL